MEKEIIQKVSRYLNLSKKFQKSEHNIFDKTENNHMNSLLTFGNSYEMVTHFVVDGREIYIDDSGTVRAKDKQPITRSEKILAQAKLDASIANEYDEYMKLQQDLESYFKSLENLIK